MANIIATITFPNNQNISITIPKTVDISVTATLGAFGEKGDTGLQGIKGDTGTFENPMATEIDLGENAGFILDSSLSADGKYSGITTNGTAGTTLAFGDLCYLDPDDSRWELADGNSGSGIDGDCTGIIGICVEAASLDGDSTKILMWGKVRASTFPSFTVNSPLYVSEIAGDITHTQPSSSSVIVRIVGRAISSTDLFFNPDSTFIELVV